MFRNNEKMKEILAKVEQIRTEVKELDNMIMTEFIVPWSKKQETDFSYPRLAVVMSLLGIFEIKDSLDAIEGIFSYSEEEMKECLQDRDGSPEELYSQFVMLLHEKSLESMCDLIGLPSELLSMLPPPLVLNFLKEMCPEATREIEGMLGRRI